MKIFTKTLLLLTIALVLNACQRTKCSELPSSFSSFKDALTKIRGASFELETSANTSSSSWIDSAEYYSCNGSTGYLILETEGREYIHENVPLEIWNGFESADSKGEYYNDRIKHHYRLIPSD
jgi:KTSC domain